MMLLRVNVHQSREKAKSASDLSQLFPGSNNGKQNDNDGRFLAATSNTCQHQQHSSSATSSPTKQHLTPTKQGSELASPLQRQRELTIAGRRFSRSLSSEPPIIPRIETINANNPALRTTPGGDGSANVSPTSKITATTTNEVAGSGFRLRRGFSSNSARRRRKNQETGGAVWGSGKAKMGGGVGGGQHLFEAASSKYNLLSLMKEPLKVVNSVPLNIRLTPAYGQHGQW